MNQTVQIGEHLKRNGSITALQALRQCQCMRLSARIFELKERGWGIEKEMVKTSTGKRVARYFYHVGSR